MTPRVVPVDALKSVSVLFPGDLYDLACFLLKALDAKAVRTNAKGRPTVPGLASSYARLIIGLPLKQVEDMLQRNGFDLGATVEWHTDQAMPEKQLLSARRKWRNARQASMEHPLNLLLTGPPSCGKTTVILRLAELLRDLRLTGKARSRSSSSATCSTWPSRRNPKPKPVGRSKSTVG